MITNNIRTAEQIPSSIGTSAYGRAFGMAAGTVACAQTASVVLDALTGAMGHIKGDFPGTPAWRPPSC